MSIQKAQAIVLKKFDFRDTSLIVTLFTRDFGKIKCVVKGVRKEASSDLVNFEVLSLIDIIFYEKAKSELHLLSESSLADPMSSLRQNFRTMAYGWYLADLVDSFFELHEASPRMFDLFAGTLKELRPSTLYSRVLRFELEVLKEAGMSPGLAACVRCRNGEGDEFFWSTRQGGLLCPVCGAGDRQAFRISPEKLFFLRQMPVNEDHPFYEDVEGWIREFIRSRAESPMKSLVWLDSLDVFSRGAVSAPEP